ncbi:beta-galactosidase trimerization domain-containing protein [Ancylobacter sp. MQZ15Z-1]|uniref:Beta-galactosidase trimerization domain-containing protein n=1 Tax=Ancylobacter mangrovi TaxID=2972472 RepID=A0A9X2PBB3_9HYPH|nr:alpha-amylase family protein [Ancylobacter mangrovi]MCS0495642.1 beta-galactosidase trimerization domain-containing protein [Ancylobacter mangrovi]
MTSHIDHSWLKHSLVMIMTLREGDAGTWDAEKMADFAQSFSLDALGFSVGGIVAFYPTQVKHHPRAATLGDRDLAAEMIAALKKRDIRPVARIDPSMASRKLYEERPEWFAQDKNGKPIGVHGHFITCPNGGYYRDFMMRVIEEMLTRYPFDAVWANAAQFSPWHTPQCHCGVCRSKFRARTGKALPAENWGDETWRQYNEWRYECIAEWNAEVQALKNRVRPEAAWIPLSQVAESWDHSRVGGWDLDYTEPHQDGIVLEAQRRYANMFWPGLEARYMRDLAPEKGGGITVSYFLPWWRFYAVPAAENRMWAGQIMAQGVMPWIHVTGYQETHFDKRGLDSLRATFARFRANRDTYLDNRSGAEVALVYSRHSLDNIGQQDPTGRYLDHFRGAYNAMMDQRVPFDILSGHRLSLEALKRYRAVVLPNAACLSDAACDALEAYVRGGGHLVATHLSGNFDALGNPRAQTLLGRLAGITQTGVTWTNLRAAYGVIRDPDNPLMAGFEGTDLIPVAGDIVFVRTPDGEGDGKTAPLTLVPPVEGEVGSGISVPEFNVIKHVTDYPMVVDRPVGEGRVVYFPWQPDLIGFRYGLRDLFRLLANAVKAADGFQDVLRVTGPGLVDLALLRREDRLVLSLINFSSPGSFNTGQRRIIEELVPLHDLVIDIRAPEGFEAGTARLVFAERDIPVERQGAYLRLTLPKLEAMETIEIRGAGAA